MKTSVKKSLVIEIFLVIASILNFIFPKIFDHELYVVFLLVALGIVYATLGIDIKRNANDRKIMRNMLIYILVYYLVIYLFGLYIGFARTIYSYSFTNLTKNILPTFITILLVELIRHELINKTNKDKLIMVSSCITFILFEISKNFQAYNMEAKDEVYKYIGLIIIASITKNILMTIIHSKTDTLPTLMYRLITEELIYVCLIFPNIGPYLESVGLIILPILMSIMVITTTKKQVESKPKDKKRFGKLYFVVVAILLILVGLNSGFFKYQIMVIGSNSMYPYMEVGDVILIDKLSADKKSTLKKGDILAFRYDNKIITHRITRKDEKEGKVFYKTKGDNNNQEDDTVIDEEKVIGKVLHRVKYVGLPSVWVNQLFD